jgi:hypothetical protein
VATSGARSNDYARSKRCAVLGWQSLVTTERANHIPGVLDALIKVYHEIGTARCSERSVAVISPTSTDLECYAFALVGLMRELRNWQKIIIPDVLCSTRLVQSRIL